MSFTFNDLDGKTVVLTGAAWGIGRGLAHGLAAQGVRLLLIDRDADQLAKNAAELTDAGVSAMVLPADLSDPGERTRLATKISDLTTDLHGIIHNAAIDPRRPLEETDTAFLRHVMATNVEPAVDLTRHLLPLLRESGRARVVLIGSITFRIGPAMLSAYVASKGALVGVARALAHELGADGITVNCIEPGAVRVEKETRQYTKEHERLVLEAQSLKRRLDPDDLLGLVCLLLSNAGEAISGQVIGVDGGFVHPWAAATTQEHMAQR